MKRTAFVLLILALIAIGAASLYVLEDPALDIGAARESDREQAAIARAAALDTWFESLRDACRRATQNVTPWTGFGSSLATATSKLDRGIAPPIDRLYVLDHRSRVVAANTTSAPLMDQLRSGSWVDSARQGSPAISGLETDPLLKDHYVAAAMGLSAGGPVTGVLVCHSRIGPVQGVNPAVPAEGSIISALASAPRPEGVRAGIAVASAAGIVEISGEPGAVTVVPADRTLKVPAQATAASGSVRYRGEGSVWMRASYAAACCGWDIVLAQDEAAFMGTSGRLLTTARLSVALMLLVAVIIAVTSARMLRSVERRTEEAKRAFLAIAGHELRTPLTVIRGFSQTLTQRWDRVDDERKLDILRTIARHARSLEHLVERLLLGAQLEAGVLNAPSISETPLEPIVSRVIEHHRDLTHLHDFTLVCPAPVSAQVDPKLFDQVVTHLVENAVKYSPAGGLVSVELHKDGSRAVMIVEDEGVGLPADIDQIFDKFVQGEDVDTRTHDEGGVGLGLFIVKTHLDRMRGQVKAERRAAGGARFVVSVPR